MIFTKDKAKEIALKLAPQLSKYRIIASGIFKKAFVFLRHLPGSSMSYGPPRGIYKNANQYNETNKKGIIAEILIKEGQHFMRKLPVTNSKRVIGCFGQHLEVDTIAKTGFNLPNARYLTGYGGTVITSDDKVFFPASPLRNESKIERHQSLYLFKLPKPTRFDKAVLIDTRACQNNYYHWLKDHITRFYWLKQMNLNLSDYVLVSSYGLSGYYRFSYDVLKENGFVFKDIRHIDEVKSFHAKELVIPPYTTKSLNAVNTTIDAELSAFLKSTFLSEKNKATSYEKIYISRRRSDRTSAQETALVEMLTDLGFQEIFLEEYNISQQAWLFNHVKTIISFHGAGLTNTLFCQPGTTIVEIFGADFIVTEFWSIASQLNFNYLAYCDDEYLKNVKNYRLARLTPTQIDLSSFLEFLKVNRIV